MKQLNKLIAGFLISSLFFSCKNAANKYEIPDDVFGKDSVRFKGVYINYNKWVYPGDQRVLNGQPKEVKELRWDDLSDTTFSATAKLTRYFIDIFDREGNIIGERSNSALDEGYVIVKKSKYTGNGFQEMEYTYPDSVSGKIYRKLGTSTVMIADSVFKQTAMSKYAETLMGFSDGGRLHWKKEVAGSGYTFDSTLVWYEENKEVRSEIWSFELDRLTTYMRYYSPKGFLDSVVSKEADLKDKVPGPWQRVTRTTYINNEYGDPVYEIYNYSEVNGDTRTDTKRMKYEYDAKGNWIKRMLVYTEWIIGEGIAWKDPKKLGYELTTREITY
jgi:hypothetical protein